MTTFADKLKAARDEKGWTQAELAKRCKVPAATLSHYETGSKTPGLKNLMKILRVLKLEI